MSVLTGVLFPSPPSVFVSAMSVISFSSLAFTGASEIMGRHLRYSKFWDAAGIAGSGVKEIKMSSRTGMLLLYFPAAVAATASFAFPGILDSFRARLVAAALAVHFAKRVLEVQSPLIFFPLCPTVLCVHQYSGQMILDSVIPITLSYFLATVTTIYSQYLTHNMAEPAVDLKYAGVLLFLIGISGNFYHHYLLSKLRSKGENVYKIPKGGLFGIVICPHYLYEIIGFIGISLISQTVYALSFTLGSTVYLMGRSYVTRQWYRSKFEDFPKDIKAMIPFLF